MERFFIVSENSPLAKQYHMFRDFEKKSVDVFKPFAKEQGITAENFCPGSDRLGIVPTEEDMEKFSSVFTKERSDNGLRFFRRRSVINTLWLEAVKKAGLEIIRRPIPHWDLKWRLWKYSFRLFDHNDVLYLSIDTGKEVKEIPADLTEIKASEFWKVVEEIEAGEEQGEDGR